MANNEINSNPTLSDVENSTSPRASKDMIHNFEKSMQSNTNPLYAYSLEIDGVDVTPLPIIDPDYQMSKEPYEINIYHTPLERDKKDDMKKNLIINLDEIYIDNTIDTLKINNLIINLDDIHIDNTINTEEGMEPDVDLGKAPSDFRFPLEKISSSCPREISFILKETPTIFIIDLPSETCEEGTTEADIIDQENNYYEYITVGEGNKRQTSNVGAQTIKCLMHSRYTEANRPLKKNATTTVSLWDINDTYDKISKIKKPDDPDGMVLYQNVKPEFVRKDKIPIVEKEENIVSNFESISKSPAFLSKVLISERILAANEYSQEQKQFRGIITQDPLDPNLVFVYTLTQVWTFQSEETDGRSVSNYVINQRNQNIIAVAYGKFKYLEDIDDGMICIWCTKNPSKPERLSRFDSPATALAFSQSNPSWLGCGFENGDVLVLDVASHQLNIIMRSTRQTNPCFEPIWTLHWAFEDNNTEFILTTCQDGRVNRFNKTITNSLICTLMVRATTIEGKMIGIQAVQPCIKEDVPILRFPAVLCFGWNPKNYTQYFIGTDEGYVYKCSIHYISQFISIFRAHVGPVYSIRFSPFVSNILVTSGADKKIRIWIEDIQELLLTLDSSAPVISVALSPVNATLIIAACANVLSIWDIRRKCDKPCAEYKFNKMVILTKIKFLNGNTVFVSDTSGKVYTFKLTDVPISPFFQKKMLFDALEKALRLKPELIKKLENIEDFYDELKTKK